MFQINGQFCLLSRLPPQEMIRSHSTNLRIANEVEMGLKDNVFSKKLTSVKCHVVIN